MNSPANIVEAKNAVLQKIGRNVVNFQKMERMLKFLNLHCEISAPLSDLERIKQTAKRIERLPMGVLADRFIRSAYSDQTELPEEAKDSRDIWISTSITFEASDSSTKAVKKALSEVVKERNLLIHQWLSDLDPNSIDSCKKLSARLDDQHAQIWPQFQTLALMIKTLKEHRDEVARLVESDAFITLLRDVTND